MKWMNWACTGGAACITVAIGSIRICFFEGILIRPVGQGEKLHLLTAPSMEKLADSFKIMLLICFNMMWKNTIGLLVEMIHQLGSCRATSVTSTLKQLKILTCKLVKMQPCTTTRWNRAGLLWLDTHPWFRYLKVGDETRSCAYCIEAKYDSGHISFLT